MPSYIIEVLIPRSFKDSGVAFVWYGVETVFQPSLSGNVLLYGVAAHAPPTRSSIANTIVKTNIFFMAIIGIL